MSSDDLKLLMHEGKEKYAIRGLMDITLNGKPFQKGEMNWVELRAMLGAKKFRYYSLPVFVVCS